MTVPTTSTAPELDMPTEPQIAIAQVLAILAHTGHAWSVDEREHGPMLDGRVEGGRPVMWRTFRSRGGIPSKAIRARLPSGWLTWRDHGERVIAVPVSALVTRELEDDRWTDGPWTYVVDRSLRVWHVRRYGDDNVNHWLSADGRWITRHLLGFGGVGGWASFASKAEAHAVLESRLAAEAF